MPEGGMMAQSPSFNQAQGTILAGGTLSSEINLLGYTYFGLQATTSSVNGTLGFMVSNKSDADGGVYRPLTNNLGVPVAVTAPSGQFSISGDALTALKGYQFMRISSTAQTNGLALVLTMKSE